MVNEIDRPWRSQRRLHACIVLLLISPCDSATYLGFYGTIVGSEGLLLLRLSAAAQSARLVFKCHVLKCSVASLVQCLDVEALQKVFSSKG